MDLHRLAELVSLALTPPTITTAVGVVFLWSRAAMAAFWRIRNGSGSSHDWFIVGVVVGFVGGVFDNAYWALPWSASYLDLQSTDDLMGRGVYFNIVSRQAAGIMAAYCHLRAASEAGNTATQRVVNRFYAASWIAGVAGVAALLGYSWMQG